MAKQSSGLNVYVVVGLVMLALVVGTWNGRRCDKPCLEANSRITPRFVEGARLAVTDGPFKGLLGTLGDNRYNDSVSVCFLPDGSSSCTFISPDKVSYIGEALN